MGNYPESCEMHALTTNEVCATQYVSAHLAETLVQIIPANPEEDWSLVLPRTKLGPHRRHFFQLENVLDKIYTHVRLTIYPDGGVKRVRVIGKRDPTSTRGIIVSCPDVSGVGSYVETYENGDVPVQPSSPTVPIPLPRTKLIPALPLTPEAFAPFGHVVQAYANPHSAPRGVKITPANQGSALKFHKLAPVESVYPPNLGATTGLSVYRCKPLDDSAFSEEGWEVQRLERHRYTNQAFIPMGGGRGPGFSDDALSGNGRAYLVVVAGNNSDGSPNLESLRAFIAGTGQGIVYNTGVWRTLLQILEVKRQD